MYLWVVLYGIKLFPIVFLIVGELKIPAGTSVYYALDNNIKEVPLLILKLKHR